jgi:hypothetical protein
VVISSIPVNKNSEHKAGETLMSSKLLTVGLTLAVICGIVLPPNAAAAEWAVSPFRAQIAGAQAPSGATSDSVAWSGSSPSQKKNIGRGVMFSLVIPGTGQLYSGSWIRAVPWFVIEVAAWATYAHYHGQGRNKTDEFEAYAGSRESPNHFSYRVYMYAEYMVARDRGSSSGVKYEGTFDNWLDQTWEVRSGFLPPPFTHDVLDDDRQQYFEMIGKYFVQFGWGWQDTYNGGNGGDVNDNSWLNPAPGLRPDDPATVAFDGESPMFFHYADMRGEANDLLDKGNVAMEVVLANHILSALDAAFAVRHYNKKVTQTPSLGDLKFRYDVRSVGGEAARFLTVSMPLD